MYAAKEFLPSCKKNERLHRRMAGCLIQLHDAWRGGDAGRDRKTFLQSYAFYKPK